ncbi:MAG: heparan-alpha-glucosaminide N-acetyltransferase domain-containing protein [Pseudomonadota bacterium]
MAGAAIPNDVRDPLVEPVPAGLTRSGAVRLDAIDMLRGLVIAIMVLDHVRDYFHAGAVQNPTDPATTVLLLYLTRWVTHLCAPTFVFLAGVSILFQKENGKPPAELSRFLLTRGTWLVLLECTVITFGFNFGEPFLFLQVIWAIGFGMICMAALARLPAAAVLAFGVAIIALCPLAIPATEGAADGWGIARTILLAPGLMPGAPVLAMYAAIPWLGVMCLGFGLGPVFRRPAAERARAVLTIALVMLALFVVLRLVNAFGDPAPWSEQANAGRTAMSFFNVSKYPPSPDYVLVTLGLSLLVFLALERLRGPVARVLLDFGRTPLFSYVAHIYLAHGLMLAVAFAYGVPQAALDYLADAISGAPPVAWGFSLGGVYLVWALVIAALIPLARWFAGIKRRRRDWWLSYL